MQAVNRHLVTLIRPELLDGLVTWTGPDMPDRTLECAPVRFGTRPHGALRTHVTRYALGGNQGRDGYL